jgi:hypothetical protein
MFYKLLGIVVWKAGKLLLRRRYPTFVPKPVLAGAAVAVAAGAAVLLAALRRQSDD